MPNTAGTIKIDQSIFESYSILDIEGVSSERLENLDTVNVLIGPNSSGKSRFLRTLFSQSWEFLPVFEMDAMSEAIDEFNANYKTLIANENIRCFQNQPHMLFETKLEVDNALETLQRIRKAKQFVSNSSNLGFNNWKIGSGMTSSAGESDLIANIQKEHESLEKKIEHLSGENSNLSMGLTSDDLLHVYVPVLRGLRSPSDSASIDENPYLKRTLTDYGFTYDSESKEGLHLLSENHFVFTGLELYKDVTEMLLGDLDSRRQIVEYQRFLSTYFFENQEVALIPKPKEDVLTIKIGNEHEQPIYNVGDGLQHILIQTFPIFKYKDSDKPMMLYIEEPDLYLHPGMQRQLMHFFLNTEQSNAQVFVTTHSNHLLDLTLDMDRISIYSCSKSLKLNSISEENVSLPTFEVANVENDDVRLLDAIGVKNSAVFLSNCTIWVEGIYDRGYLRKYLELYRRIKDFPFIEDIDYSFVEYSGSNITHWCFLDDESKENRVYPEIANILATRLSNRILLIADGDASVGVDGESSEAKKMRHEILQRTLESRYIRLTCREIENTLPQAVVQNVILEFENGSHDEINSILDNEYSNLYLGNYINEKLGDDRKRKSYAHKSGTIAGKGDFCQRALVHLDNLNDYTELTNAARDLVEKIVVFIEDASK
jgi:predicted ATP-dependent endonuclease of OLD family